MQRAQVRECRFMVSGSGFKTYFLLTLPTRVQKAQVRECGFTVLGSGCSLYSPLTLPTRVQRSQVRGWLVQGLGFGV